MTGQQPGNPGYEGAELGRVVDSAMNGILAKLDAAFDPEAGLADIYARSTANRSTVSQLAAVCDQIDLLSTWLTDVIRSGQQDPFSGSSYLDLASDNLMELRAGLASRTMARPEADRLTSEILNQLGQADRILGSRHGTTLDGLAGSHGRRSESLTEQAAAVRELVARLYEPGHDLALTPPR